jgi:hypothetical protein
VDFFDDDAPSQGSSRESTATERRPQRRRPNRSRTRIQRIVVFAAIFFIVVFALALWARSCQHNRKVASYRTYFQGVGTAIADSNTLGKQLNRLVNRPTKYSHRQLVEQLQSLSAKQSEIAARAARLQAPGTLAAEQAVFAESMKVRAQGYELFRAAMLPTLNNKAVSWSTLAALAGYFSGPDAYYMSQVYTQARNVLKDQGISDVTVPTASYYLDAHTFDRTKLEPMLSSIHQSAKLSGIHCVGLVSVTARPAGVTLTKGKTASIAASTDLSFDVKVQNQGNVTENNVGVTCTFKLPDGSKVPASGTISSIAAGQTGTANVKGFTIPATALSKVSTLKVTAGPVPGERTTSNNSGTYKILLRLK